MDDVRFEAASVLASLYEKEVTVLVVLLC